MAAADPKRGDRLRLENYWYFAESVRPLVPFAQALKHYHSHANKCQVRSRCLVAVPPSHHSTCVGPVNARQVQHRCLVTRL